MDPLKVIGAAAAGVEALLQIIGEAKAQAGLTDDQIMAQFETQGSLTKQVIAGYLANLPPA